MSIDSHSEEPELEEESALIGGSRPRPSRQGSSVLALPAAFGAAAIGALVWAAVTYYTNYEIGWIAWGIGAAVGGSCLALGGRTLVHAMLCATIAFAGIAGGKLLGAQVALVQLEAQEQVKREKYLRRAFDEYIAKARRWVELGEDPSTDRVRAFMFSNQFGSRGNVPSLEVVEEFKAEDGPRLLAAHHNPPSWEAWYTEAVEHWEPSYSFTEVLQTSLSVFDLLWVGLGVMTAFGIIANAANEDQAQLQAAAAEARKARRAQKNAES